MRNRPIVLFELNGVLIHYERNHTDVFKRVKLRNGVMHLLRLKKRFRVGVFSTMSPHVTETCVRELESRIGYGFKFDLVMHSIHCNPCPKRVRRHWLDMTKPIDKYFDLDQVVVFDTTNAWYDPRFDNNVVLMNPYIIPEQMDMDFCVLIDIIINTTKHCEDFKSVAIFIKDLFETMNRSYHTQINPWFVSNQLNKNKAVAN